MSRMVRVAGDGEVALQYLPRFVGQAGAVRGAGQEALGDLACAASTDAGDAGNRQDVLHEGLGGLRRLALDGSQQARMLLAAGPVGLGKTRETLSRHDGPDHAPLGGGRDPQSIDQGMEKAHVTQPHDRGGAADLLEAIQGEGEDLGVDG